MNKLTYYTGYLNLVLTVAALVMGYEALGTMLTAISSFGPTIGDQQ